MHVAPEHEFEAEYGLPEALPNGERLLWQGAPDWRVLARDAMHLRALALYFAVLLAWRGATVLGDGRSALDAAAAVAALLPLALIALAVLATIAWLVSRTSVYTITDKRVVLRIGVVLNITFNLPYTKIDAASLRLHGDGSGDVSLVLDAADRIAYLNLWPHARPWHFTRTQPTLRGLRDAQRIAALLSTALAEAAGQARVGISGVPARPTAQANHRPLAA